MAPKASPDDLRTFRVDEELRVNVWPHRLDPPETPAVVYFTIEDLEAGGTWRELIDGRVKWDTAMDWDLKDRDGLSVHFFGFEDAEALHRAFQAVFAIAHELMKARAIYEPPPMPKEWTPEL